MNWEVVGAFAEVVGAVAVVVSLVYLASQIRMSNRLQKSDALDRVLKEYQQMHNILVTHGEFAEYANALVSEWEGKKGH